MFSNCKIPARPSAWPLQAEFEAQRLAEQAALVKIPQK
jgi:hypothetical protein